MDSEARRPAAASGPGGTDPARGSNSKARDLCDLQAHYCVEMGPPPCMILTQHKVPQELLLPS